MPIKLLAILFQANHPDIHDVFWHYTKGDRPVPVLVAVSKQDMLRRCPPWERMVLDAVQATPAQRGQRVLSVSQDPSILAKQLDNSKRYLGNQYGFGKCNIRDLAPGHPGNITGKSLLWCYTDALPACRDFFGPTMPCTLAACDRLRQLKKAEAASPRASPTPTSPASTSDSDDSTPPPAPPAPLLALPLASLSPVLPVPPPPSPAHLLAADSSADAVADPVGYPVEYVDCVVTEPDNDCDDWVFTQAWQRGVTSSISSISKAQQASTKDPCPDSPRHWVSVSRVDSVPTPDLTPLSALDPDHAGAPVMVTDTHTDGDHAAGHHAAADDSMDLDTDTDTSHSLSPLSALEVVNVSLFGGPTPSLPTPWLLEGGPAAGAADPMAAVYTDPPSFPDNHRWHDGLLYGDSWAN
eukprot:TRINITY_DN2714_c0_g2_i1.p1 TRINITY_DN2714_c0_g2~~TRINITY_DN2714_c0_g2_i1.p1  ORF type:complete len:410 (-),score=61.18 TRINITY_DN2714_c0_g2_i1:32-1261(-)